MKHIQHAKPGDALPPTVSVELWALKFSASSRKWFGDGSPLVTVTIEEEEEETVTTDIPLADLQNLVAVITKLHADFCQQEDKEQRPSSEFDQA